ncbi:Silent information regulator family protein [Balamuthia mandrillaris]
MAWTAHKTEEEMVEHFDPPEVVQQTANGLATWMSRARHMIVFTGAGISTSAGIPDFRGPEGVWTLRAKGVTRTRRTTSSLKAIPTPTHMALVELERRGILKYVISQNTDGLHRKSGLPPEKLSELHGNTNLERCSRCGAEYMRDYHVRNAYDVHDHRTGRTCVACGGELRDTIINFHESLPYEPLRKAQQHAEMADLCLVLGSSCTVTPAANFPRKVGRNPDAHLVICNLQHTPLDPLASLRVNARCDDLMRAVMAALGYEIPPFILRRRLRVRVLRESGEVEVQGVDVDGKPASFLSSVQVLPYGAKIQEPFRISREWQRQMRSPQDKAARGELPLRLHFMGHYNEPHLDITVHPEKPVTTYDLAYDPMTGQWDVRSGEEEEGAASSSSSSSSLRSGENM